MSDGQRQTPAVPQRRHDRTSFFKYMPAGTAFKVLESASLRWSSPLLFNDRFDFPRELMSGIAQSEVVEAMRRRLLSFIARPPANTSDLQPDLSNLITHLQTLDARQRAHLIDLMAKVDMSHLGGGGIESLREQWKRWLPEFRVLCLAEHPSSAAMWHHYADKYSGVVMELACDESLDVPWLLAGKVEYPEAKPDIYSADGLADLFSIREDRLMSRLFELATLTKTPDWSYEREWRVVTWKAERDTGLYTDIGFHPRALARIYLGPDMAADQRERVARIADQYPIVHLVDVSVGFSREFVFGPTRPPRDAT